MSYALLRMHISCCPVSCWLFRVFFCLVSADSRSLVHAGAPTKALRARPSANVHGDRTLSSGARLCVRMPPTCLRVCVRGWGVDITGAAFFSLIKQPVSLTHTWRMCDCVHSRKTSFCPITLGLSCCFNFWIKHGIVPEVSVVEAKIKALPLLPLF